MEEDRPKTKHLCTSKYDRRTKQAHHKSPEVELVKEVDVGLDSETEEVLDDCQYQSSCYDADKKLQTCGDDLEVDADAQTDMAEVTVTV